MMDHLKDESSHSDYSVECSERAADNPAFVVASGTFEPTTERERIMVETAYRRGFQQGYFSAWDAVNSGCSLQALSRFIAGKLHAWRFCRHNGKFDPPPEV